METVYRTITRIVFLILLLCNLSCSKVPLYVESDSTSILSSEVNHCMSRALIFLKSLRRNGGYLGAYDLQNNLYYGQSLELPALATDILIEDVGTPRVGYTMLKAYYLSGNKDFLEEAEIIGETLAKCQTSIGGWSYWCDPTGKSIISKRGRGTKFVDENNLVGFDDGITQNPLRFFILYEQITGKKRFKKNLERGLHLLLESQYENGAWPLWYPKSDSYLDFASFNDGVINQCIDVLIQGYLHLKDKRFLQAIVKAGKYILSTQLSDSGQGWAQQYDEKLRPVAARRFEPPAVSPLVTGRNIETLVKIFCLTKDSSFIKPIPSVINWLKEVEVEGKWYRFHDLKDGRPFFVDRVGKKYFDESSKSLLKGYEWRGDFGIKSSLDLFSNLESYQIKSDFDLLKEEKRFKGVKNRQILYHIEHQKENGEWSDKGKVIYLKQILDRIELLSEYYITIKPIDN